MSNWNAKNEMIHLLKRCRDRPELFNKLFLNRPAYWSRQMDLCRSVVEHRTTVAYSGNMVGKDYWIAGIIIWWLFTRPDSLCIITGPSQIRDSRHRAETYSQIIGIVPNRPSTDLTLCAAKRLKFGASAGGKTWERASLTAPKVSSRHPPVSHCFGTVPNNPFVLVHK